ncbi:hypothetical protein Goshw_024556 [Gossypium schwendimanii]|uniref:DUF7745 domain-containing protein n=1 Tax=Gossypium schwendimanii TaxID=34291 RepID=A0A7J9L5M7_GOSSC|nr:hypothetical protein [Gossypium schwendimanii]
MQPSEFGLKKFSRKKVIASRKDTHQNYGTSLALVNYGDLPFLLDVKVDKHLFRALVQYWNPAYSCFMFGKVDLVPIVEEYTTLLRCPRPQIDKAYLKQPD